MRFTAACFLAADRNLEDKESMTKKLFIGSLAYATTDDTLLAHFAGIGPVASAKVIYNRDDSGSQGTSKGFGFVEYENDEDAKKAIEQLDNSELDGRTIHVNEARPREERPPRSNFGERSNAGSFRQRSW